MIPEDDLRFEVKLTAPQYYLPRLHALLRLHPEALSPLFAPRWINNVYIDSEDLSRLNQNYAGIADRCKLRYRWYGPSWDACPGAMEFKHKHGKLGWKRLFHVERGLDLRAQGWNEFLAALSESVPHEVAISIHNLTRPVLINRYHREYYATPDQTVRLTVDTEQQFYGQLHRRRPNLTHRSPSPEHLVVELKARRDQGERVDRVLRGLPLLVSKNSKYVLGCESSLWMA